MGKRPTVYLSDEQYEWVDSQDGSFAGTVSDAIEHYRNCEHADGGAA